MAQSIDVFAGGDNYDFGMGAWSKVLAPLFIEFVGGINEGDQVLDVGCGTGALALTIAQTTKAAEIKGIDPSRGFIEYARAKQTDPRVSRPLKNRQSATKLLVVFRASKQSGFRGHDLLRVHC